MRRVHASVLPVAVGVGALALLATACNVDEAAYTGNTSGRTVAIVGDDMTANSSGALHTALDAAYQSRNISHNTGTFTTMQASATTLAGTTPEAVVVDLGTNDANTGVSSDAMLASLDTIIAEFPSSCVVVVNLNEQSPAATYSVSTAQAFNAGLATRSVRVADWNGVLTGNLATYTSGPNQLYPTADGQAALSQQIGNTVNHCFSSGE